MQIDPDVRLKLAPFAGWENVTFDISPLLSCVERRADGTLAALLGYDNPNSKPITVPIGEQNAFQTSPQNRGQPTSFLPGQHANAFSVDFDQAKPMAWRLNGTNLPIAATGPACPSTTAAALAQDTTVTLSSAKANFGSDKTLTVGDGSDALVQFDRAQLRNALGTGRYVAKATLTLSQTSGDQPAIEALPMTKRWSELGATWNCANDLDLSPTGQVCPPGNGWKLERDDETQRNPWLVHSAARSVVGAYTSGKVSFDVTRDVWNLLGADGFQHPAGWALVKRAGATGSALLASRESTSPPQLVLTLATRPQTAPALSVSIDPTLKPKRTTVPALPDGVVRTVAALRAPKGPGVDFVERELLFDINDDSELPPILARWKGVLVREIRPPAHVKFFPTTAVVRIDTNLAQADALLPRLLEIDNRPMGAHAFSSAAGLATMAAAAEEVLAGRRVSLNWLSENNAAPSIEDWSTRIISEGQWTFGGAHPSSSNPFFWPGFASCDPDPGSPNFPPPCRNKFPDGSGIFQQLTVADSWRALALGGRMIAGSVGVALVDAGFAPSHPDYPPVRIGGDGTLTDQSGPLGDIEFAHGTYVTLVGFGAVGNHFGAAGPGGPVSRVTMVASPVPRDGLIYGLGAAFFDDGVRVISTSVHSNIPALATVFTSMSDLTQDIRNGNVLLFASAGNDNANVDDEDCFIACWESTKYSPCEDDGVDCVTGMELNGTSKDPASNWGSEMKTIAGPYNSPIPNTPLTLTNGLVQPVPNPDGSFDSTFAVNFSGTSGSTPFIAGVTTLLIAADPSQSADRIEHCLYESTHRVSDGFFTRAPDTLASLRCVATGSAFGDLPTFLRIDQPSEGASVGLSQLVNAQATATDYETGELTVGWQSDIDGVLTSTGSGQTGVLHFRTNGVHHVTASAVGSDGKVISRTITVVVNSSAPAISIVTPAADEMHFPDGFPLAMSADNFSLFRPNCSLFKWSSTSFRGEVDFDGLTGCQIQPKIFGVGQHHVVVSYKDPDTGLTGVANRLFEIDAVNGFLVQIVNPVNVLHQSANIEIPLSLEAVSNGANVSYQWSVSVGGFSHPLPGTLGATSWNPLSFIQETCDPIDATIRVSATNDDDASQSHDVETIRLFPSEAFVTHNCVQ